MIEFRTIGAYIKDNYGGTSKFRVGVPADIEESICSPAVLARHGKRVSTRMAGHLAEAIPQFVRIDEDMRKARQEVPRRGYIADAIEMSKPYVVPGYMNGAAMVNISVDKSMAPHIDMLEYGGVITPKETDMLAIPLRSLFENYGWLTGRPAPAYLEEMGTPRSVIEAATDEGRRLFVRKGVMFAAMDRRRVVGMYVFQSEVTREPNPIIAPAIELAYAEARMDNAFIAADKIEGHPLSDTRYSATTFRLR